MSLEDNPFWVWTPEDIDAEQAVRLFVDMFSDFPAIESPSHTFIQGPRGSGKSMMFRMMRPDCARLRQGCALRDLRYLGISIPIKRTEISQTELVFLENHPARYIFNEHLLCLYFAGKIFDELASERLNYSEEDIVAASLADWANKAVLERWFSSRAEISLDTSAPLGLDAAVKQVFRAIRGALQGQWGIVEDLIRALPLRPDALSQYSGPLFSYHSFLIPLLTALMDLSFVPKKPVYLLVDDADNLSRTQTEILNSWIATRTTSTVCIKASTQLRYKTRLTFGGQRIESPHDFHEVDVSVLYTTKRDHYLQRLSLIVKNRLEIAKIEQADPHAFFPEDPKQAADILKVAAEYREKAEAGEGRGNRLRDDAIRYARPEFIRRLGGERKSTHSYSYSGFEQLAHISSGVIRWFLEPAAMMFATQKSQLKAGETIAKIEPSIQNERIRDFSEEFFIKEFEKMRNEAKETCDSGGKDRETDYQRLEFLINAMGKTFSNLLKDETRSERRVFSIALSDVVDEEVKRVLDLGVQEGYLYRTSIGTKEGNGRTLRYVLSRRLAPFFSLDPTSFSGYLFVTNQNLRQAMFNPRALLRDPRDSNDELQMELAIE